MCENSEEAAEAEICGAAKEVVENLLPDKSARLYKQCYTQFLEWQKRRGITSLSEATMLVYFDELAKTFKPSSLWAKYSMFKSTVINFHNVDIGKYKQLAAFMAKNSKGFVSNKSKILQPREVEKFLAEAPDHQYLAIKARGRFNQGVPAAIGPSGTALLLYNDHVKGVSLITKELIFEYIYKNAFGKFINIIKFPVTGSIWAYRDRAVFKYRVTKEDMDIWQAYIEKEEFELAKQYCKGNSAHIDQVLVKQAEMLFKNNEFEKSAIIYADKLFIQ